MMLWTTLFVGFSVHSVFLSLLFLSDNKNNLSRNWPLSLLLFIYGLVVFLLVSFWNDWNYQWPHLNYIFPPLPFLMGPLMLFYIKKVFGIKLKKYDFIHFVPYLIVLIYYLPFYFSSSEEKLEMIAQGLKEGIYHWDSIVHRLIHLGHILSLVGYTIAVFYTINNSIKILNVESAKKISKWLHQLAALFAAFSISFILYFLLRAIIPLPVVVDMPVAIVSCVTISLIGWMGYHRTKIFEKNNGNNTRKYQRSGLKKENAIALQKQLIQYMDAAKPYLTEGLSLQMLSKRVDIPVHYISEILNVYLHTNFAEFVNGYRVEDAKRLLISKEHKLINIESVAYEVGFSSRATFYKSFKKTVGMSPKQFQAHHFQMSDDKQKDD